MDEKTLDARLRKLESRGQIEDLLGLHFHLLLANEGGRIMDEIWAKDEAVSLEIGASGPYSGREKVSTYYEKDHIPGKFTLLMPVTPVIRVSEDASRAVGVWFAIGLETDAGDLGAEKVTDPERRVLLSSRDEQGRAYTAEWMFQKIEADFVRENDVWKILHMHIYEITRTPQDSDWVQYATERFLTDGQRLDAMFKSNLPFAEDKPPENLANGPTQYHWQYTVDSLTECVPDPTGLCV